MERKGNLRMQSRNGNSRSPDGTHRVKAREQLSIFSTSANHGDGRRLTSIDLFCGAGGIAEGMRQAGFDCLFANDVSTTALETFHINHPNTKIVHAPIEELDARQARLDCGLGRGELDCLAGGPPCQGFSINAPERLLDDPRNSLFRHYLRFVDELKPRTIFFENVPGMLSLGNGAAVSVLLDELVKRGYDCSQRILFAAHYGVPQERWRLIILASRVGPAPDHPLPRHRASGRANFRGGRTLTFRSDGDFGPNVKPQVTVSEALDDLPPLQPGEGAEELPYDQPAHSKFAGQMRFGSSAVFNHFAPNIAQVNVQRLRHIPPGGSWRDVPRDLLPAGMKRARRSDHTRRYGRLVDDGLAGTVMTKMDPHWGPAFHHRQDRTLTVREAARLQSFPDRYRFSGSRVSQYEQVGNAVPVLMSRAIGVELLKSLSTVAQSGNKRVAAAHAL